MIGSMLDFIWKFLVVVAVSSTFFFGAFVVGKILFKNISGIFLKQWARMTVAGFLLATFFFALFLLSFDQGLQVGCFNQFMKGQGGMGATRILGLIWFAVAAGVLLYEGLRYFYFVRTLKNQFLSQGQGFTVVEDGLVPLTYGFLNPQILIPQSVAGEPALLRNVFAHEKTHADSRDGIWNLLEMIFVKLCWFNPLAWSFHKSYNLVVEMATDEQAIQKYNLDVREYCESLLQLSQHSAVAVPGFVSLGVSSEFKQLRQRLMNLKNPEHAKSEKKTVLMFMLMALWILGIEQSWASVQVQRPLDPSEMVCMQVQHEMVIEKLLLVNPDTNKTNKCE